MPIYLISKEYTDAFGNVSSSYKNNTGDYVQARIVVHSTIRMSSANGPLILDPTNNQITSTSGSWLMEGFRVGDTVLIQRFTSGGSLIFAFTTAVEYVDDAILDVSGCATWYDNMSQEICVISVVGRSRGDLDFLVNHVQNGQTGSPASLIDAESTRSVFTGISSMSVGDTISGDLTGNQSGQFVSSALLERLADISSGELAYEITFELMNSGLYNQSAFDVANCLKLYYKFEWCGKDSETAYKSVRVISDDANTGWFDQAHNTSILNASVIQGITSLDFAQPTTFEVIVDGPTADIGIGAMYRSFDDAYYKNRLYPQQEITMAIPTTELALTTISSSVNEFGAGYDFTINSFASVGTQTTINVTMTPNANMDSFFQGREDGDKLFYVWIKCGNVNLLVFADQLTYVPPAGGPLNMTNSYAYFDHSEQVQTTTDDLDAMEFNTEDDIAYFGRFTVPFGAVLDSFKCSVVVKNSVTDEEFSLESVNFSFLTTPVSGAGVYLINQTVQKNQYLLGTSEKREVILQRDSSIDTLTEYGLSIYYPIVSRWEDWIDQANANVDFYPNQNKNWVNYLSSPDWEIKLKLALSMNDLEYTHYANYPLKDYDSEPTIDQEIILRMLPSETAVDFVVSNSMMKVIAIHTLNDGSIWSIGDVWGQITVEPNESNPRYDISTVVPYDNNPNNPLTPLAGSYLDMTFPSPETAVLTCYFNPALINLDNGVKFTTKIKGCQQRLPENSKFTTDNVAKITSDGTIKITA